MGDGGPREPTASARGGGTTPTALRTRDFDYSLPERLIAQRPLARRDASRLLVLRRGDASLQDLRFQDIESLIAAGDALALNVSRVFPARLLGRKPSGAPAEILLLEPLDTDGYLWRAMVRPGAKLKPGRVVEVGEDLQVAIEESAEAGSRVVRLMTGLAPDLALETYGRVPLPPYIRREDDEGDRSRYQTVYAERVGSVAAPTAGLHFTEEILRRLTRRGVRLVRLTLHIGPGTFRPVQVDDPREHEMDAERYRIDENAAAAIEAVRAAGGRVWAVGTTTVRALESAARPDGTLEPSAARTDLFIRPGYTFRVVDRLITNFHLPRSTLLMLVAAFAGYGPTMSAYRHAVERGYRFYSYGDAMAVV